MSSRISPLLIFRLITRPQEVLDNLAQTEPSATEVFFKLAIWMIALPPIFAYFGSLKFGWRLGATEPLVLSKAELAAIDQKGFNVTNLKGASCKILDHWKLAEHIRADVIQRILLLKAKLK